MFLKQFDCRHRSEIFQEAWAKMRGSKGERHNGDGKGDPGHCNDRTRNRRQKSSGTHRSDGIKRIVSQEGCRTKRLVEINSEEGQRNRGYGHEDRNEEEA